MTKAERAQSFKCGPFHGTITRGACAERYKRFASKGNRGGTGKQALGIASCTCRGCPIGKTHARGKVAADVELVTIVPAQIVSLRRVRRCIGCGEPLPADMSMRRGRAISTCSERCGELAAQFVRASQESQLPECG